MRVGGFDKLRQEGDKKHHHFRIGKIDADASQKGCKNALFRTGLWSDRQARSVPHRLPSQKQQI